MTMPLDFAPYFRWCRKNCQKAYGGTNPRAEFGEKVSATKARDQENGIKTLLGFKDYV
jgi:hypothetical protein